MEEKRLRVGVLIMVALIALSVFVLVPKNEELNTYKYGHYSRSSMHDFFNAFDQGN